MKSIKLTAIAVALMGSTAAMAAQPAYQYDPNAGVISNTTGAVVGTSRTLFDTVTHPGAVSAEIGTLGYGANIAWGVNESTELQAGWTGMKLDDKIDLNANDSWINWEKALGDGYGDFKGDLDYKIKMSNPYLGVQMRPMSNWLTVGAGVMVPRNEFTAKLTPKAGESAAVTIDGQEFEVQSGTTVSMKAENKNPLAPYATIGIRPNINNRWGAFAEVGAAYMGDVKSDVKVDGVVTSDQAVGNAAEEFQAKAKKELEDANLEWYPIAKLGVTYRF